MIQAYMAWAAALTLNQRVLIWLGCVLLIIIYAIFENWGQPWMKDDDWHDDSQLPP